MQTSPRRPWRTQHNRRVVAVAVISAGLCLSLALGALIGQAAPLASHQTLATSLVAFWTLDETSGTRLDTLNGCGGAGCDLTAAGVGGGYDTGKIGNAWKNTNTGYLSHADDADLSTGNIDFSVNAWVYATAFSANPVIAFFRIPGSISR